MEELFVKTTFNHSVSIEPSEINNRIEYTLIEKINNELEGKCNNSGYIKENSIKILSRSLGKVMSSHFTGSIIYNVSLSADICNPLENSLISARIININKMGVLAQAVQGDPPCLTILLAKQHHIENDAFDNLQINQIINIKVIGKRFEYGDKQISIIALLDKASPLEKHSIEPKEPVASGVQDTLYYNNKDNKWLSRSYNENKFTYNGRLYETIEHAFQAQKVINYNDDVNHDIDGSHKNKIYINMFVADSCNYIGNKSSEALKLGTPTYFKKSGLKLREDWIDIRRNILKDITRTYMKEHTNVLEKLVKTGKSILINKGGKVDTYWGVNTDYKGDNENGKIMMELREELSI